MAPRRAQTEEQEVSMRRLPLLGTLWAVAFVVLLAHVGFFVVVMERQVRLHF